MSVLVWIVFGLVIGLLARAIMPGPQKMGIVMTTLLGIAGSLLGGFVGSMLFAGDGNPYNGAGWLGSLLGALALLFLAGMANRRAVNVP